MIPRMVKDGFLRGKKDEMVRQLQLNREEFEASIPSRAFVWRAIDGVIRANRACNLPCELVTI